MTITINGSGTITGATTLATTVASPTLTTPNIDSAQIPTVSGTAPLYMCRAWVNFDGTTNTGGFCTIRGSGNISSVADNGTGSYTVNIDADMPDANYAVTIATSRADFLGGTNGLPTAGAFNVNTRNGTNAQADTAGVFAAIFR